MLGPIFVFSLLAFVCIFAIFRPAIGLIGMYGFLLLDPAWNWRWSLPEGIAYQKYIFFSLAIGFALSGFRSQPISRQSKIGLISLLTFLVLCFVSTGSSVNPPASQFFMSVFWKEVLVVVLGILVLDSASKIRALMMAASLAQGYNAFQITLDYFQTGVSRYAYAPWGSTGADNNGYSIITVPILGITLALAFYEKRNWLRFVLLGVAMLQIHQIMLLESRGCMLGALGMIAILVWYMPRTRLNMMTMGAAMVMGALLAGPSVVDEFRSSFSSSGERDASAESRLKLWTAGWRITMDHPITGVGPNAARSLVPQARYYPGGLEQTNKALHNLFFDVSTAVGIPGFLLYILVFSVPVFYCWRTYDPDDEETGAGRLAVFAGLAGYLASSMFSSGLLFESCYVLVVVGYAISNIDLGRSHAGSLEDEALSDGEGLVDFSPARVA